MQGGAPVASAVAHYMDWTLETIWDVVGGRPEPVAVTFKRNGAAVTADPIRKQLPIAQMLSESRRAFRNLSSQLKREQEPVLLEIYRETFGDFIAAYGSHVAAGKPQRGRALTDDDLAIVADAYRHARTRGESVNQAVMDAFPGLTPDGAAKRIGKARAMLKKRGEEL